MILIIDNYDSFTYNLVQCIGALGADVAVVRNDRIKLDEIAELNPSKIVISPGPGRPREAGISIGVVKRFYKEIPILGVCLGHQAIAAAFGGRIVTTSPPVHGKVVEVHHPGKDVYRGIKSPFKATRYNSLVVTRKGFPRTLEITAETEDELVMGLSHRRYPVVGVQYHPESIMTTDGRRLITNFLKMSPATRLTPGKAKVFHLPDELDALRQHMERRPAKRGTSRLTRPSRKVRAVAASGGGKSKAKARPKKAARTARPVRVEKAKTKSRKK